MSQAYLLVVFNSAYRLTNSNNSTTLTTAINCFGPLNCQFNVTLSKCNCVCVMYTNFGIKYETNRSFSVCRNSFTNLYSENFLPQPDAYVRLCSGVFLYMQAKFLDIYICAHITHTQTHCHVHNTNTHTHLWRMRFFNDIQPKNVKNTFFYMNFKMRMKNV